MASESKFPTLCIPRAMLFHKADFVEKTINIALGSTEKSTFVKSVESKTTKDKDGKEFNVFFITPNQDFEENTATKLIYSELQSKGFVNIALGSKGFFWKVKLYVPNLKAKFAPETKKAPAKDVPRIMTEEDNEAFKAWREKRLAAKAAKAAAKGPWEEIPGGEEGEIFDE
jgi:hypothetical protein